MWRPFVGEAGTFDLTRDTITMQATVAKNPAAMNPGAVSVYAYRQDGDTLSSIQVRGPAGANPVTIRLVRSEWRAPIVTAAASNHASSLARPAVTAAATCGEPKRSIARRSPRSAAGRG